MVVPEWIANYPPPEKTSGTIARWMHERPKKSVMNLQTRDIVLS